MRVLVAPDSFGGWRRASAVAATLSDELRACGLQPTAFPLADGGEGSSDVLSVLPHSKRWVETIGPLGSRCRVPCLVFDDEQTFVESALTTGPLTDLTRARWSEASTLGLGRLLHQLGSSTGMIRVGLGGSATVDCGLGALLGMNIGAEDAHGRRLRAGGFAELTRVRRLVGAATVGSLELWADVRTPLHLSMTRFAHQKGVPREHISQVTDAVLRFADVVEEWSGSTTSPNQAGGGAAGGLGYALSAATGARLVSGGDAIASALDLEDAMRRSDVIVCGEGRLDETSFDGKVVGTLMTHARALRKPVIAVVGSNKLSPEDPRSPSLVVEVGGEDDALLRRAARSVAAEIRLRLSRSPSDAGSGSLLQ